MRRWTLAGLFVLLLSLVVSEVHGDLIGKRRPNLPGIPPGGNPFLPPGGRPLPIKVKLVVKVNDHAKLPVLQVPINLALGQQPAGGGAALPPEGADAGRQLGLPTIIAGLALTLALSSGGLWMVRRGSRRSLAILLVLSLFAAGTAAVWANGVFLRPQPQPAQPGKAALPALKLPAGIELTDKLILEPVLTGDHLTLIVPKSMVKEKDAASRVKPGK